LMLPCLMLKLGATVAWWRHVLLVFGPGLATLVGSVRHWYVVDCRNLFYLVFAVWLGKLMCAWMSWAVQKLSL
jgi:hypothetical protein